MADKTITSANSVFSIRVPGLYPTPVQLEGYSAEKAWSTDQVDIAETVMSVDGIQSAGFVPNSVPQTISLQADSASRDIFNSIVRATKAKRDVYYIYGTIDLPSTGESFNCVKGVLKNFKVIPDASKVLQAVEFQIVWQDIQPTLS